MNATINPLTTRVAINHVPEIKIISSLLPTVKKLVKFVEAVHGKMNVKSGM